VGACVERGKGNLEPGPTPAEDFDPVLFCSCDIGQAGLVGLLLPFLVFN